jgi:hypothetical protein
VNGAAATFKDVTITAPGEDAQGAIKVAAIEFEGLDMSEAGANFARLTLKDVSVAPPADSGEVGALNISKLELLNPSPALAAWVATLNSPTGPGAIPAFEQISFDAATLGGLKFSMNDGSGDVNFALSDIKLLGFKPDGAGLMQISGLSFDGINPDDGQRIKFGLGNMAMTGVNKRVMDAFAVGFQSSLEGEDFGNALNSVLSQDPTEPGYDRFEMKDLGFEGLGLTFALPVLESVVGRNGDGAATRIETKPFTMTFKADATGGEAGAQVAGALSQIGYESIELTGSGLTTYDPATDTMTYDRNELTLKDGFTLNFTGKLGGMKAYGAALAAIPAEALNSDPTAMLSAFGNLSIGEMNIVFEDKSLVDRILNLAATQSGEDPEALRQQVVMMSSMAPMMAAQSGLDAEVATELSTAFAAFIQKPGKLTISLKPPAPITMTSFTAPEQATKAALGFSAKAE